MNTVYYRSILYMYFVVYALLYFGATRFTGKIIYVIEPLRVFLKGDNSK